MCKKLIYLLSLVFVLSMVLTGSADAADPNLQLWLKFEDNTNDGAIVGWGFTRGSGDNGKYMQFRINNDVLRAENGGGNVVGNTEMTDGEWHHVAVTVIANAGIQTPDVTLYLDGFDDTETEPDPDDLFDIESDFDVRIGRQHDGDDNRDWNGDIDDLRIYDYELSAAEIRILAGNVEPILDSPADEAILTATNTVLKWAPGVYADNDVGGHEVYLSDSLEDVNAGAGGALFATLNGSANQKTAGGLDTGKVYYWKVDAVNDSQPPGRWSSELWSFTVPDTNAWDPFPPDEARFIDPNVTLEWQPGMGMAWQDVYFGTNFADVNTSEDPCAVEITDTNYYPGPLAYDANYYWCIDTNDGGSMVKGLV